MKLSAIPTLAAVGFLCLLSSKPALAEGPGDLGQYHNIKTYFCYFIDDNGKSVDSTEVRADDEKHAIAKAAVVTRRLELGNGDLYLTVNASEAPRKVLIRKINCEDSGLE